MRVLICRRTTEEAEKTRRLLLESGAHTIALCRSVREIQLSELPSAGADVCIFDCEMPYWDGRTLAAAVSPAPCLLIAPGGKRNGLPGNAQVVESLEEIPAALCALADQSLSARQRLRIREELLRLGFKANTRGTRQLGSALEIVLRDENTLDDVLHYVYTPLAVREKCSPACIERNIRYAIECAWVRGELSVLQERFGYTIQEEKGKPTNRAFLAQISEHIRLHRA